MEKLRRLVKDEEGASIPEYALLVALIAVAAMAALGPLGTAIQSKFVEIKDKIAGS